MFKVFIVNNNTNKMTLIRKFDDIFKAYDFAAELYETITGKKGYYELDPSFGFEIEETNTVIFVHKSEV